MNYLEDMNKFGFGLMRLPRLEGEGDVIDVEQTSKMVDAFLDAGMKYFDTAFVYVGSEEATRKALVERHPRDSYFIASKLNAVHMAHDEESAKQQFYTTLERLGVEYLDFYLLHNIQTQNYDTYEKYGIWDYVKDLKEKGLIRHYGFSFHDGPELLDKVLTEHPDAEFVQLQINYADWFSPSIQSKEIYEVARKHNKPIIVMEPIKGGTLATPPQAVIDLFKGYNPEASVASWAMRYVASLDGIMTVLSGMSSLEQMEDNLSYMKDFKPLNEEELKIIAQAQEIIANTPQIPCTSCEYCLSDCPMHINIPRIFTAMNKILIYNQEGAALRDYDFATRDNGLASSCIKCGLCESHCPQHIEIREWLEKAAERLEK